MIKYLGKTETRSLPKRLTLITPFGSTKKSDMTEWGIQKSLSLNEDSFAFTGVNMIAILSMSDPSGVIKLIIACTAVERSVLIQKSSPWK